MTFMRKIGLWGVRVRHGIFYIFPCLSKFLVPLEDTADEIKDNIKQMFISHLDLLHRKSVHYFSAEETETIVWV
jgi:hypothetical protein